MPVLAKPDTIAGPLTAQDLSEARAHLTGSIWRSPHRLPAGCDQQGRHDTRDWQQFPDTVPTDWHGLDDCAAEGGAHHDPAPTKTHKDRPGIGIALVLAPWLIGVIGWALYVRWAS